jgi:hypothetical protein
MPIKMRMIPSNSSGFSLLLIPLPKPMPRKCPTMANRKDAQKMINKGRAMLLNA